MNPQVQGVWRKSTVAEGAYFLDQHSPGWASKVDPKTVNVANAALCPLGQLYGTSEKGCRTLGIDNYRDFLLKNGFAASSFGGYMTNVEALNAEWRRAIQNRR